MYNEGHNTPRKVMALSWLQSHLIYAKPTTAPAYAGAVFSFRSNICLSSIYFFSNVYYTIK